MTSDNGQSQPRRSRLAPEESVTTIGAPLSLSTTEQTGRHQEHDDTPMRVVVTDVRIKFWSMVTLVHGHAAGEIGAGSHSSCLDPGDGGMDAGDVDAQTLSNSKAREDAREPRAFFCSHA